MVMMVVMKLTDPRIVAKPPRASPITHIFEPMPGENVEVESGA